ncbi:MAG: FliA/WhiG family RNA polymerase sigma factor [Oligoflexales bacterium]
MQEQALKVEHFANSGQFNDKLKSQLVNDYAPLVSFIARRIAARLPASVDINDLISTGFIGLLEAIDKYDPTMENKFKTYGEWRIRGAILDELRNLDLVPRSVRDKIKLKQKKEKELEQKLGRKPSIAELSEAMGIDTSEYHRYLSTYFSPIEVSLTRNSDDFEGGSYELLDESTSITVEDKTILRENFTELKFYLSTLPKQHSMVLNLYYFYELNLKECAYVLELSESRISQIRSVALERLKLKLDRSKTFIAS